MKSIELTEARSSLFLVSPPPFPDILEAKWNEIENLYMNYGLQQGKQLLDDFWFNLLRIYWFKFIHCNKKLAKINQEEVNSEWDTLKNGNEIPQPGRDGWSSGFSSIRS